MEITEAIISDLYEAILQPSFFNSAMQKINKLIDCKFLHLLGYDATHQTTAFDYVTDGVCKKIIDVYLNGYGNNHYIRECLDAIQLGEAAVCGALFDVASCDDADIELGVNESGSWNVLVGCVYRDPECQVYVLIYRCGEKMAFSCADVEKLNAIMPHLVRAYELMDRSKKMRCAALAGEQGLNALNSGVVVVDRLDRVVYSNEYAIRFFKKGGLLFIRNGRISSSDQDERMHLHEVMNHVRKSKKAECFLAQYRHALSGGFYKAIINVVPILRSYLDEIFTDSASPLFYKLRGKVSDKDAAGLLAADVLLQITCPEEQESVTPNQLTQIFGLTQAEGRLAHALSSGLSVDDFARESEISVATARTQLRSVLLKTNENRQQDLVRLLARIPLQEP